MKNTLFALLGFLLLSTPRAATAQQFGDFTYSSDGSAITITGYTGPGGAVTIPASINGLPVTSIGDYAFGSQTNVTSVNIPGSVTSIGTNAFGNCTSLTSVTIPGSVRAIGGGAFSSSALTRVTILNGVTSIGNWAFFSCINLTNVTIPGSVISIGSFAFGECHSLKGVFFNGDNPGLDPSSFLKNPEKL